MGGTVVAVGAGQTFSNQVLTGSLLLALPIAVLAGLVSFASPCVLPLVPGYLSYVTGLSGSELADSAGTSGRRSRVLLGTALFVLGFTAVFVSYGLLFGGLGGALREHQDAVTRVLGGVTIVLGLAFAGWLPGLNREWRLHGVPQIGLVGAPLLGVLFGVGWTPCIGPTLGAVQSLAFSEGSAGRGALLSVAYCAGLGVPFLIAGLAYRRALGAFAWVRRHRLAVMRTGGVMLVILGILLVSGAWGELVSHLQGWIGGYVVPV